MISDSNKVTNVEVKNENDISTSEVIQTNDDNDQNLNTSTIAKVDDETMVSSEISTSNKALYSFCKEKSIVNALTVEDVGTLEIQTEIKNNAYGITLLPNSAERHFDKLMDALSRVVLEVAQCPKNRPNIGDLLYGKKMNEDWVRGYVVSQLPFLKMAIIDEAKIETINDIATCDKIISDIYAFGALCEVTDARYKFEEGDVCEFEVPGQTHNKEGGFEILIHTDDVKVKATVKPWIPTPEEIGVQCAEVNNETEVCVTGYRNHIHLFVRPINTVGLEHYNHVMQTVAKCAEKSPFLRQPPGIGDMVIAQSADENYYRAYVTRVEDGRITILYLDLGRKEVTDMKKLKILPDNLKKLQYCMTKVVLKDVPRDIPLIKEIDDYLAHIVTTKVPLLCIYDGIPSIDGVYLKFRDGESVNNMICKFLKPKPKEAAE
ncbi:uncharacterized protein LOC122576052 [Bombus pyrosoma]|uniref:uncharacterized protein LOC122576052 n=1 Tax=Bombus pyrosoma TaxID=396416 RepID=UPI001CB97E71|nr:uncharacterized protein LOC122576052 [Bombus pyrosoma]